MARLRIMVRHFSLWIMALGALASLAWLSAAGAALHWALIPLGALLQMVNEYVTHRFTFHRPPPKAQWAFNLLWRAHYGHHEFPTNEVLLFVPIWYAIPAAIGNFLAIWGALWLIDIPAPFTGAVAIVGVGGFAMFLGYEWFHMTAHMTVRKTAMERRVTRLHAQHHFRDFSKWYHVSFGGEVIDHALGTAISRDALKAQSRMEFITTLGLKPNDPRLIAARRRYAGEIGLTEADISRAAQLA